MSQLQTSDAEETQRIGAELARRLVGGDVVLLSGELGSGKTTLVRGACRELGVTEAVTSPTFAIANRYVGAAGLVVSHLDLYRIGDIDAEAPDLLGEYLGPDRVAFIEWPGEQLQALLGRVRMRVHLEHLAGERRRIEITE